MSNPAKVVIMGHSYVYWLQHFIENSAGAFPAVTADWTLSQHGFSAPVFFGVRGGTVAKINSGGILTQVKTSNPALVVIQLGGNDLDDISSQPARIGMDIFDMARSLSFQTNAIVCICQVVRRQSWRNFSTSEGNRRVDLTNEFLRAVCDGCPRVMFWKHKGLWNTRINQFRADGVHLNNLGNFRFYRSLRGAIVYAANTRLSLLNSDRQ